MYYSDHHHDHQPSITSSSYIVLPPPHPVKDEERKLAVSITDAHSHQQHYHQPHMHHNDTLSTASASPSPVSLSVPWLDDDSTSIGSRDSSDDSSRHHKRYHPSSTSLSSRSSPFTPILDGTISHYAPLPAPHSQQQAMYGIFMTGGGYGSFSGLSSLGAFAHAMTPVPQQQQPHQLTLQHHAQHAHNTASFPLAYSHSQYSNQHSHAAVSAAAAVLASPTANMHHSTYPPPTHSQTHPPPPPLPSPLPSASLVSYLSPASSTASTSSISASSNHTLNRPHPSRPAAHSIPRHIRSLNQTELLETDIHLSRTYPTLLELLTDDTSGLEHSFEWTMRHGLMPTLTVRYVRDGSVEDMVKPHVEWMLEDLDRALPLLGVDAETGLHCTRLLQISTRSRCLLIRIPMQSHTHLYSTHHSHHHHHHHQVRIAPSLVQLLESRVIHKSGAELWGDALDLYRDLHVTLNAALNMSWCHRRGHFSLSLEHMCNLVLGKDAFVKDKDTTLSDWDRPVLTFRQLVYGALDAQASYIVASVGEDGGGVRPTTFNCADMSSTWLSSAASWLNIVKYVQREQEVVRTELVIEAVQFTGDEMHVRLKAASGRLRWERCVYVLYADSSEELMRINKWNGREMVLSHIRQDEKRRVRSEGEVVKLSVVKERQDELLMTPVRQYLSRYMHGEEPFNPFIASILDLPFMSRPATFTSSSTATTASSSSSSSSYTLPLKLTSPPHSPSLSPSFTSTEESYLSVSSAPQPWWFEDTIRPLTSVSTTSSSTTAAAASHHNQDTPHPHPTLCVEQKDALTFLFSTRILAITGGPGTGKTQLLVAHLLSTTERALVLTESTISARHLCEQLSMWVGPDECGLFVGEEVALEWEEGEDETVREGGYLVEPMEGGEDGQGGCAKGSNRRIMITTVSYAFSLSLLSPHLFFPRPLLAFDDANQVWLVKVLLLLRFLTSTERMLVVGDSGGLTPSLCKDIHHPLSLLSQLTILAQSHHLHSYHQHRSKAFTILHAHLSIEHRMVKHVTSLISTVFYPSNPLVSLDEPTGERNVFWRDSRGTAMRADNSKSVFNMKECEEVIRLYLQLEREGWKRDEIAVLCFYDAQQEAICEHGGRELGCRVYLVEQFAGRETDCVIVSLASEFLTPTLSDRYRINVACSRARQRLYIVGNRITLARVEGHWKQISEFEQREPMRKAQVVPDLVADFPSLGAAVGGTADSNVVAATSGASHNGSSSAVTCSQQPHASPKAPASKVGGGGLAWSSLLASNSTTSLSTLSASSFPAVHHDEEDEHGSGHHKQGSPSSDQSHAHDNSLPDSADKWQNGGFYWKKTATASSTSASASSPSTQSTGNHTAVNVHQPHAASANLSFPLSATSHRPVSYHPSASPHGPSPSAPHYKSASFSPLASLPTSSPSLSAYASPDDPLKPFRWRTSICHFYTKGACQNGSNCNFAHGEWEVRSLQQATNAHAQWSREQQMAASWSVAGVTGLGGMVRGAASGTQMAQSPKQQFALPPQPSGFGAFSPSSLSSLSLTSPTSSIYSPMRSSPLQSGRAGGASMPAFASLATPLSVSTTAALPGSSSSGFSATSAIFSPSTSSSLYTPQKSSLLATSAVFTPMYTQASSPSLSSTPSATTAQPTVSPATSLSATSTAVTAAHDSKAMEDNSMGNTSKLGWDCRCSLVNGLSADRCEACAAPRPAPGADVDSVWKSVSGKKPVSTSVAGLAAPIATATTATAVAAAVTSSEQLTSRGKTSPSKPSVASLTSTTSITTSNGHTIKILSTTTPATVLSSSTSATPQMRRTNSGTTSLAASATPTPTSSSPAASAAGKLAAAVIKKPAAASTNAATAVTLGNAGKGGLRDGGRRTDKPNSSADDKRVDKRLDPTAASTSPASSVKPCWTCPQCTYANDSGANRCEMCDTERKDDWKPVTTGKKATGGSAAATSGGSGATSVGTAAAGSGGAQASVVLNNPFAAVMNGHGSGSKRKGR